MVEIPDLAEVERLAEAGQDELCRKLVRRVLDSIESLSADDLCRLARLAERLGMVVEATTLWQHRLEARPEDIEALEHLAAACQAAGDLAGAITMLERRVELPGVAAETFSDLLSLLVETGHRAQAGQVLDRLARERGVDDPLVSRLRDLLEEAGGGPSTGADEDEAAESESLPTDGDVLRFLHLFRGREDVYARMWKDADDRVGYSPVRRALTPKVVRDHLVGHVTVGSYVVRLDGSVGFFALDLDLVKSALASAEGNHARAVELRDKVRACGASIARKLGDMGLDVLVESSGFKGRHFWVFLDPPQPADRIHQLGRALLAELDPRDPDFSLEFFPKQGATGDKLGNLIKLPLGIHLRTGRRSLLLDDQGHPLDRPFARLRRVGSLDPRQLASLEARFAFVIPKTTDDGRTAAEPAARESPPPPMPPSGPAPPAPPPLWTAADFEQDPATVALLGGCPLLAELVRGTIEDQVITAKEISTLRATLGHLPRGVGAVNYLLDRCPGVPESAYMKTRLSGNPVSCQRVRQRLLPRFPDVACDCEFEGTEASYPTPLLHVSSESLSRSTAEAEIEAQDPERIGRRLGWIEHRLHELSEEAKRVRSRLIAHLRATGADRLDLGEGMWVLTEEEGVTSLRWKPRGGEASPAAEDPDENPRC
ncbi:MAG: CRISPR-associated primase-polymerase type A1 [Acidobacteriota bacterium]|nr:CRISPR-associated primase-polymerase type A1 [Acidobacteriota bacterium]